MLWLRFLLCIVGIDRKDTDMAVIYVALIVKGLRTYKSVPDKLKPRVKELLEQLELSDLIEE